MTKYLHLHRLDRSDLYLESADIRDFQLRADSSMITIILNNGEEIEVVEPLHIIDNFYNNNKGK